MDISIIAAVGFTTIAVVGILFILYTSCGCKKGKE
jgi:hypothetical protein